MPPQTPAPTPSPTSQFDFITQNGQPTKKPSKFPLPNIPKPILIVAALIILFVLYSTISSAISKSNKPNYSNYVSAIARSQEITRVSLEVEHLTQSSSATQNLASTTNNVLSSWQQQLTSYLKGLGVSISSGNLNADRSAATDATMKTAATNNLLDSTYISYLKAQLAAYENSLKAANATAGPHGKALISEDIASIQAILNSPQVANAN